MVILCTLNFGWVVGWSEISKNNVWLVPSHTLLEGDTDFLVNHGISNEDYENNEGKTTRGHQKTKSCDFQYWQLVMKAKSEATDKNVGTNQTTRVKISRSTHIPYV